MDRTESHPPRASRRRAGIRWCPRCRALDVPDDICFRCPPDDNSAAPVRLVRGLGSIALADDHGLVHYWGERTTTAIGLGLLALVPLAAAFAMAWEMSFVATILLGIGFVGLPVLAFVDARRAGDQQAVAPRGMPACAPTLDRDPDAPGSVPIAPSARQPVTVLTGQATSLGATVDPPLTQGACLMFRLDIRAGAAPELVARYTSPGEFAITCADGTQAVITGVVELTAPAYQTVEPSHSAHFQLHGEVILPALFTHGGWACEIAVRHGDRVEVRGPHGDERRVHPLGTDYRQPGTLDVLRGTPAHPVVVTLL